MTSAITNTRNIGIIAHIDAGKTTVTERMLYYCGAKHKMGDVDKGTAETDFDPEEQQRGITIYSACVTLQWNDVVINLIDTPGHVDFTAEVERSLRVLDGGVVVFSAREGVEAQSETVWRQANKYDVPRIALINKLDREGADFAAVYAEIATRLGARPVAIQIPVGAGPAHAPDPFRGVIDLVTQRMLTFTTESQGATVQESDIPEPLLDAAENWRARMLEALYDYSDELMELALAEQEVPVELLRRLLRDATIHGYIQPVLCASALNYIGIQPLLDAVDWYLPSPADMPPVEGTAPKHAKQKADAKTKTVQRAPNSSEPFCGLVFKIIADRHGELSYVRVYSGKLTANSRVLNPGKNTKENVAQLWRIQADHRQQVPEVEAGDIVGIIGLKSSTTGDTLCQTQHPILLEQIAFPETVISMAIEPASSAERKKLSATLELMRRQDPTFNAEESEETGQTLISGMGELHLEVIRHRLLRDFNLDVKVHPPRVSYRETISRSVQVVGECQRQISGQALWATIKIAMQPVEGDAAAVEVTSQATDLPPELEVVALEVLTDMARGGGSLGFPLINASVTILGAELHPERTNEVAIRIAATDAFNKALTAGGIVLLEPIMKLQITTPEEYLGEFISDLRQRRAVIHQTSTRGAMTVVDADAPLACLFGYSSAMRSLSQGRASSSIEPSTYGPAPPEVLARFT